jgi:serine protein kinase
MDRATSPTEVIQFVDQLIHKEFDQNRRLLAFDEYLGLLRERPTQQLRASARYVADMMDHFGRTAGPHGESHFNVFDIAHEDYARRVIGQEQTQSSIYRSMRTFARQGLNNKLVLLHGPNGSAKTSIAHGLMAGMERYSRLNEGAIYTFSWVFPIERYTKGGMGLGSYAAQNSGRMPSSFAKLPDEEIAARIPCEMKDHPLLIIPREQRRQFLERLLGEAEVEKLWNQLPLYLTRGELNHRDRMIFDSLLASYNGELKKVLMHIQVERFYFSRRYRRGIVTIEPQLHVDAHAQQVTMNRSLAALPSSLQSLNLFSLGGDLVDGNRGLIEYSDLLKRPVDSFKYLLIACETGSVNVGSSIAYLDAVMIGSTNELQLDAFKEFPDFMSFKARIELIRVPYLLSVSQERKIYQPDLQQIAAEKPVAPHTDWTAALWAVLTRLKKPNSINYPPNVSSIVSSLTPLEKSRLYDTGEMPVALGPEERKLLKSNLRRLREEYENIPYYEGRVGASAREMKSILYSAAQNPEFPALSPLAVLRELEGFVKRVSEYDFLKQDVKDGYHDAVEFINVVRNEYLGVIDREVRDSIGLYNTNQWEDFLRRYVQHTSLVLKKEKIKNPITGRLEDPDMNLIDEFEKIVEAPKDSSDRESWRQNIISQVGAWSLDHPSEPVVYSKVFPEYWTKLEKHYYESQKALLTQMHNALLVYGRDGITQNDEGSRLAQKTVDNMCKNLGYTPETAREVITFLMKSRY